MNNKRIRTILHTETDSEDVDKHWQLSNSNTKCCLPQPLTHLLASWPYSQSQPVPSLLHFTQGLSAPSAQRNTLTSIQKKLPEVSVNFQQQASKEVLKDSKVLQMKMFKSSRNNLKFRENLNTILSPHIAKKTLQCFLQPLVTGNFYHLLIHCIKTLSVRWLVQPVLKQ